VASCLGVHIPGKSARSEDELSSSKQGTDSKLQVVCTDNLLSSMTDSCETPQSASATKTSIAVPAEHCFSRTEQKPTELDSFDDLHLNTLLI
jgi:hypothetical protein